MPTARSASSPVDIVEDEQIAMWVARHPRRRARDRAGQDFVREGQEVEAVDAEELTATVK